MGPDSLLGLVGGQEDWGLGHSPAPSAKLGRGSPESCGGKAGPSVRLCRDPGNPESWSS